MNAHWILALSSVSDWIGPAIVAIFFFILPIVRAMREARERQRAIERRGGASEPQQTARRMPETDMDEARRKWEALLRGEDVEPASSAPPLLRMPEPVQRPATPQPMPETSSPPLTGEFAQLETTSAETTFDEERGAQVENETLARAEKKRRDDFMFAQREDAPVRADVATDMAPASPTPVAVASSDLQRRRNVLGGGTGMATRSGLRRAILASEVFGQPVGLRDGSSGTGPIGDRP